MIVVDRFTNLMLISFAIFLQIRCAECACQTGRIMRYELSIQQFALCAVAVIVVGVSIFLCIKCPRTCHSQTEIINSKQNRETEEKRPFIGTIISKQNRETEEKFPLTGIINSKQNCYFNAMIQVCASSENLKQELDMVEFTDNLGLFVKILKDTSEMDSSPRSIFDDLDRLLKQCGWNKDTQQDPFQLLSHLVLSLEKEFPKEKILPPNYVMCNIVGDRYRKQKYLGLSICLSGEYGSKNGEYIENMINKHFDQGFIDGDKDKPIRKVYVGKCPNVLLIHIQANKYDYDLGKMVKPDYKIKYSEEPIKLELPVIDESNKRTDQNCLYQLTGVVEHIGAGISSGHYIAHRRYSKNHWYTINDDRISSTEFQTITKSPYIFMYEKIEPTREN